MPVYCQPDFGRVALAKIGPGIEGVLETASPSPAAYSGRFKYGNLAQ